MAHRGRMQSFTAKDGAAIAYYHVAPEGTRRGGLVLVQEIFGVTDHIRDLCDEYAADGFEVISPSLFDRAEPGFEATYDPRDIALARQLAGSVDMDLLTSDIQACTDLLSGRGPVFITGYCFGGSVAWLGACRVWGLSAASGYYGRLIVQYIDERPRCPVILHFGERDASIPMADVETIKARHPEVPVHIYDADHGFNSDRRDQYDPDCARLARQRTLDLFAKNGAKAP